MMLDKIEIDGETADRITAKALKQHQQMMLAHLGAAEVGEAFIHPVDRAKYEKCSRYIGYLLSNYFDVV